MLSAKVMGSGISGLSVQAICLDVASGLTATGTTQNDAYALTAAANEFTTVGSGSGAILPSASPGDSVLVYNGGANPLKIYPQSGEQLNGQPTNAPHVLSVNTAVMFCKLTSTRWTGILSL